MLLKDRGKASVYHGPRTVAQRRPTGARPPAAPVLKSSDQGAGEGKEGSVSSMAGSPWVGRLWRAISPAASGSATAVIAVELKSGGNERGRMLGAG
jgi:hypothetical protein